MKRIQARNLSADNHGQHIVIEHTLSLGLPETERSEVVEFVSVDRSAVDDGAVRIYCREVGKPDQIPVDVYADDWVEIQ